MKKPHPFSSAHEVTWTRRVPVRYEADVVVIGGGIAGVSAACAAAKSGAKVLGDPRDLDYAEVRRIVEKPGAHLDV